MASKYDIFISYRRDDGRQYARLIERELKARGYRVFLDYEELNSGLFEEKIVHAIAGCKIFMMVLTPLYLSRCKNEEDWVRKEIQLAIKGNKKFVPVTPDNVFTEIPPDQLPGLPEDIKDVVNKVQRTELSMGQMMKPTFDYLAKNCLSPEVRPKWKLQTWMILVLGILLIAVVAGFLYKNITDNRHESHRQALMHQLENQYSSLGLNFNNSETISVAQLNAISDILDKMLPASGDSMLMGAFEVNCAQWHGVRDESYQMQDSLLPKTNVSLGECMDFCLKLSDLTSIEFNIPLEDEWVLAAKGGNPDSSMTYSGSNDADSVAWFRANSEGRLHKCDGAKYPNALGLYDMSGNAAEWTFSSYADMDSENGSMSQKAVMGGDYSSLAENITVTSRVSLDENAHSEKVGFRLIIRKY